MLLGTLVARIAKEIPRLRREPTFQSVEDMPDAIPLRLIGTELMIDATFGEANSPPAAPVNIIGKTSTLYGVPFGSIENHKNAMVDITIPAVAKAREPYLSERYPLIGPTTAKASANGINMSPALKASNSSTP